MDKKVIFAVAGSGKTTYIIKNLSCNKKSLVITYTNANFDNLTAKITAKFNGKWPENVTLMTYFQFLYRFCYKPFLSDAVGARGITYEDNLNRRAKQMNLNYYLSPGGYLYSNRLSLFLERRNVIDNIENRIERYFDEFIIDEIQDIGGRDFSFLEHIMDANVSMLFVGDFYQHTYNTSRDGNANANLFENREAYELRFTKKGFTSDTNTLINSWRCSGTVCDFISQKLGINIQSNRGIDDQTEISFVSDPDEVSSILNNQKIVKLHYQKSNQYGHGHRNWGDTKGEDCYQDVCIMLNKGTAQKYLEGKLHELPPTTRNKLYVAITRAHGNVYFVME